MNLQPAEEHVNLYALLVKLKRERLELDRAIHSFEQFIASMNGGEYAVSNIRLPVAALVERRSRRPESKNRKQKPDGLVPKTVA